MMKTTTEKKISRPIDNILAVFESQAADKAEKGCQKKCRPKSKFFQERIEAHEEEKKSSKEYHKKSKNLRERIEAYERANSASQLKVSKRSNADLDGLQFDDLLTRKTSLLNESFHKPFSSRQGFFDLDEMAFEDLPARKKSLSESFASIEYPMPPRPRAEERVVSRPKPVRQRRRCRAQRRASTQCLRVWQSQKTWECNDGYAAQVSSLQANQSDAVETNPKKAPTGLQRRHSTGCLGHLDTVGDSSTDFWQVYEQDVNAKPVKPMKESFARKRGVRFAQHVTVWVFSKDKSGEEDLGLPTSFLRNTSEGESDTMTLQMKKILSEGRFCSGKASQAPSMPSRNRQLSLTKTQNNNDGSDSSPPRQPQRQLTKRELTATSQPQRHATDEETLRAIVEDLTASPRRPVRHPSILDASTPTMRSQDKVLIVDLCSSPKKPERHPTLHDSQKRNEDIFGVWNESRGSKASKATYMYDSFADDCSQTSDCSESKSTSDIQSINSDLFSVESNPSAQYVVEITKPKNAVQDSEECRRERAMMWHRRWAMPSREMMKHHVRVTPGLGITVDDVDLLPWSTTNAMYKGR